MWLIAIVVAWVIALVAYRHFTAERVPPIERHEQALSALRDIAEHPRPVVRDFAPPAEMPVEHIRIVPAGSTGAARPRRKTTTRRPAAARRRTPARSTTRTRRSTAAAAEGVEPDPVTIIHIDSVGHDNAPAPLPVDVTPVEFAAPVEITAPIETTSANLVDPRVRSGLLVLVAAAAFVGLLAGSIAALDRGHTSSASGASANNSDVPLVSSTTTTTAPRVPKVVIPTLRVSTLPTGDAMVAVRSPFTLTFRASGNCWVQVSDAAGNVLFTGTLHADQTQQVAGGASLVVRLGNTPAIGLAVDGRPLDLTGVSHTATVRFAQV